MPPAVSDEFNDPRFNLQWQWSANPQSNWAFPSAAYGFLRLLNVPLAKDAKNFWDVPNLLLQKFPAHSFTNGTTYVPVGQHFRARQGKWIGAKVGIFAAGKGGVF